MFDTYNPTEYVTRKVEQLGPSADQSLQTLKELRSKAEGDFKAELVRVLNLESNIVKGRIVESRSPIGDTEFTIHIEINGKHSEDTFSISDQEVLLEGGRRSRYNQIGLLVKRRLVEAIMSQLDEMVVFTSIGGCL